jgi:hypothetical protein
MKAVIEGDNRVPAPNPDSRIFALLKQSKLGFTFSALAKAGVTATVAKDFVSRYGSLVELSTRRDVGGRMKSVLKN